MKDAAAFFRYWGKADPSSEGECKWHPFAYHSLDVAAVSAALWVAAPAIRRSFRAGFQKGSEETLRAWVLFFVALHDLGKLHALFQIKAGDALREAWPAIDSGNIRPRPYDHGCDGFAQADDEVPDWIGTTRRDARTDTFRDWLGAVAGHHGSICRPDPDKVIRGYAAAEIRDHDVTARRGWVEKAAELFLAPAGLTLADIPPSGSKGAMNLLAGFCSLCDWIGSNTTLLYRQKPGIRPRVPRARGDEPPGSGAGAGSLGVPRARGDEPPAIVGAGAGSARCSPRPRG